MLTAAPPCTRRAPSTPSAPVTAFDVASCSRSPRTDRRRLGQHDARREPHIRTDASPRSRRTTRRSSDLVPVLDRRPRGSHLGRRELGRRGHPLSSARSGQGRGAIPTYQLEYALYDETDGMQLGLADVAGRRGRCARARRASVGVNRPRNDRHRSRQPAAITTAAPTARRRVITPMAGECRPTVISRCRQEHRRSASSTGTVSLSSATKLRFRYMLEGLDDDWVYTGSGVRRPTPTCRPAAIASGSAPRRTANGPRPRAGSSRSRRRSIEPAGS